MINFPYISLPDQFTRLLVANIQNTTLTNNNLEIFINDNKHLNALVKKLFKDIDPDGFLGKIISIAGFSGIRNRLAACYIEYEMTGIFPETANINFVNDIVLLENKLRHFTNVGFSRIFLLGLYAKMTEIHVKKISDGISVTPLIIKEEHFEFLKFSKSKSTRIDWLMLQLIQYDHFLGTERVLSILSSETRYEALFSMCSEEEQEQILLNNLTYGSSIQDLEVFTKDVTTYL